MNSGVQVGCAAWFKGKIVFECRIKLFDKNCTFFHGFADICIFDADKIIDRAEFTNCSLKAEGLNYVIVNGEVVVEDAVHNGKRMGKLILRK